MESSRSAAPPQAVRSFPRSSANAPVADAPRGINAAELLLPRGHQSPRAKREKTSVSMGDSLVTHKDYPVIVELRIAGRSEKEIAKRLDVPVERLKVHIARALAEYRRGELEIRKGEAVNEARKVAEEKGERFIEDLSSSTIEQPSSVEVVAPISITA